MFDSLISDLMREPAWTTLGFVGQATFGGRFIWQWIASEYKKESYVPTAFWFLSLAGSLLLLIYCVHRQEPILILGFSLNTLIYIRNIHLIYKHPQRDTEISIDKPED